MNILVCVSVVEDIVSDLSLNKEKNDISKENLNYILNPFDTYSISKAILLKESFKGNITVLNVGSKKNDESLKRCLAMGADKAVRINIEDNFSSFICAKNIADYIKDKDFDLILFGKESIDFNSKSVYGMVSGILNFPLMTNVFNIISLDISKKMINLEADLDNKIYNVDITLPCVLSLDKNIISEKDIIIPNIRNIMISKSKEIEILESNIENEKKELISLSLEAKNKECEFIDENNIEQLINILKQEKLI